MNTAAGTTYMNMYQFCITQWIHVGKKDWENQCRANIFEVLLSTVRPGQDDSQFIFEEVMRAGGHFSYFILKVYTWYNI